MDYQHAAYFAGAQQYQPFMAIPRLTPAHSNSVASDDFNGPSSSPEVFDQLMPNGLNNHDQFAAYNQFAAFNAQPPSFPRPPSPPIHAAAVHGVKRHPHPHPPLAPPPSNGTSQLDRLPVEESEDAAQNPRQGSTEDEDLTPAQSRRKAQNRAAQRAFRERKEKHLKELEDRLHELETARQQAATENEKLKRDLQKMSTENEILRATSHLGGGGQGSNGLPAHDGHPAVPLTTGPLSYSPTDFYTNLLAGHQNQTPSHRIVTSDSGERLLAAGATWDYIMSHELVKRGFVDIQSVSDRLKGLAKCDGQGPVFEEGAIVAAIQNSIVNGSDELL